MIIKPAHGKQYDTEEQVLEAWKTNHDFILTGGGPYICISDFENYCDPVLDTVTYFYKGLYVVINQGCLI